METEFGLTEYACGHTNTPIHCLLKEMYSDFVVQEILADGTVLPIPSPEAVLEYAGPKDPKEEDKVVETITKPSCISDETLAELTKLFEAPGPNVIVPITDLTKDDRKNIHMFVRERFCGKLMSEMKDEGIVVSHGHTKSTRKRKAWDENVPKECHFTMAKENKETSYACQIVAKFLNVGASTIRTHGIKDKRGVTSQRVSVTQVTERQVLDLNSTLRGIRVFGCSHHHEKLQMGAHWGNRFSIVLRDLPESCEPLLHERLETFQNTGGINYYGTQRFGTRSTTTASIGLAIIRRKWEDAVKMIMSNALPGHLGSGAVGYAARCFTKTGNASKAFGMLTGAQAFATIEGCILKCLSRKGTWQQCITEAITVQNRSLYVHAYQSLLWNKIASRRVKECGTHVQENDVGADGQVLGEHATHYDIHLPLPGEYQKFESCYATEWLKELLAEDGLKPEDISSLADKFSLSEASRPLFVAAKELKWKFIHHKNPRDLLQDGLQTRAIPEAEQTGPLLALQVQFSLPSGSYATVALREVTGSDMSKKAQREASIKLRGDGDGKKEEEKKEDGTEEVEEAEEEDAVGEEDDLKSAPIEE